MKPIISKSNEGKEIYKFMVDNFYINRSLSGKGTRKFLVNIKKKIKKLKIKEIRSGTKVFDWTIPDEWNVTDGYIMKRNGEKIINFKENNLHIVGYSAPVNQMMNFKELKKKIHLIKKFPSAIPYITSYYKRDWGFCMSYNTFKKMNDKEYFIKIKSNFNKKGSLSYGELLVKGKSKKEILISCNICHPSMMSNELSGPAIAVQLSKIILKRSNYYSYRIIFIPETIGAIAYLSRNFKNMKKNFVAGYHLTCLGIGKDYSIIKSIKEESYSNRVAKQILDNLKYKKIYSFLDRGSDERQFNSPGIDLNVCTLMRSKFFEFKEYHNSMDDLKKTTPKYMQNSYEFILKIINLIENDFKVKAKIKCEPFLSKRGLYRSLNKNEKLNLLDLDIINVLSYANNLKISEICQKTNRPPENIIKVCEILKKHKLISLSR